MTLEASSCSVTALACVRGHKITLDQLKISNGKCRFCRGARFGVTIVRKVLVVERDRSPSAENLAAKALLGSAPGLNGGFQRTEYVLTDVDGAELVRELSKTPDEAYAWIQKVRLESARANLKPDQKICATCESIFTPPKYGAARDEFCSPKCRSESKAAADPSPTATIDVICPRCGKVLELRGAMKGRRIACPGCAFKFEA